VLKAASAEQRQHALPQDAFVLVDHLPPVGLFATSQDATATSSVDELLDCLLQDLRRRCT
jgi:hypothetical protein